jgi:hypothetical protein
MQQTQQESASKSSWVYEGLYEWQAYSSFAPLPGARLLRVTDSHCLLRLHLDLSGKQALVLASELESNRKNIGLALGYESLAHSVAKRFAQHMSQVAQVLWLAHFGDFSVPHSYSELTGREDFCEVNFPWPLPEHRLGGYNWKSLDDDELRYRYSKELGMSLLDLKPVTDVLVRCAS